MKLSLLLVTCMVGLFVIISAEPMDEVIDAPMDEVIDAPMDEPNDTATGKMCSLNILL